MNNPLGVSLSNRYVSKGRSNPEVVGSIPTEVLYLVWFPDSFH